MRGFCFLFFLPVNCHLKKICIIAGMCLAASRDLRAGTFPGMQRFHSWGSFLWGATLLKARAGSMWDQEAQETMQMYEASEAVCCWVAQSFSLISPLQITHALQVCFISASAVVERTREIVRTWSAERHFVLCFVSCVHSTHDKGVWNFPGI